MKVFLAGAAGAIGRRLVPLLLEAGHDVTGTTRSGEKASELKARGVEFTEEPHQMPYGIDSGFRDPSGNSVRLTQLAEIPANTG